MSNNTECPRINSRASEFIIFSGGGPHTPHSVWWPDHTETACYGPGRCECYVIFQCIVCLIELVQRVLRMCVDMYMILLHLLLALFHMVHVVLYVHSIVCLFL